MKNYKEIFEMIDWHNENKIQQEGIALAKNIKDLTPFFQPVDVIYNNKKYGKNVWDKCAIIISHHSDEELVPYLFKMFEWIKDLNLPGSLFIVYRLLKFDFSLLKDTLDKVIDLAIEQKDAMWLYYLDSYNFIRDEQKRKKALKIIETELDISVPQIEQIFEMINWYNEEEIQQEGIKLAKNIKNLTPFFQPVYVIYNNKKYSKNVWENCAIIISNHSDEELVPYLWKMLEWMQDLNWPGCLTIVDRLLNFDFSLLENTLNEVIDLAIEQKDIMWLYWLNEYDFIKDEQRKKEALKILKKD